MSEKAIPKSWGDLPLVLTTEEVADLLRMHVNSIKIMARTGKLRGTKAGRAWLFTRDDVLALLGVTLGEGPG